MQNAHISHSGRRRSRLQLSLSTVFCVVFWAQVWFALLWWMFAMPEHHVDNLVIWAFMLFGFYLAVVGTHHSLQRDLTRSWRRRDRSRLSYECPYCHHVFETRKVFPVCPNCTTGTRSRGPTVSEMLSLLMAMSLLLLMVTIELCLWLPPE